MPFRLRKDTRQWFSELYDNFELDFDMYHLCLMAGLAERKKVEADGDSTTKLVNHFPGKYKETSQLIVALFLTVELEELGVDLDDRKSLNESIDFLVNPSSPSKLSGEGMRAMNKYSFGGFEVLTEWFDAKPYTFPAFFPPYKERLEERFDADWKM